MSEFDKWLDDRREEQSLQLSESQSAKDYRSEKNKLKAQAKVRAEEAQAKAELEKWTDQRKRLNQLAVSFISNFGVLSDEEVDKYLAVVRTKILALYGTDV